MSGGLYVQRAHFLWAFAVTAAVFPRGLDASQGGGIKEPAATVPCGFDGDGMPIGFQIIAPWLDEGIIFRIAAAFEQARPWASHWPSFAR